MVSIFEKEPFNKRKKLWDSNTRLPEVYKLLSNDPTNKAKAEVHRDSRTLGLEFTVDLTIPDFERRAEEINLDWPQSSTELRIASTAI